MSIYIGEHIRTALGRSAELKRLVGNRIFPVTYGRGETEAVEYPYIVYCREDLTPDETYDGEVGEQTAVSILIAGKTYAAFVEVVAAVRRALIDSKKAIYGKFRVDDMNYQIAPERYDYEEGAYYTTIDITYTTEDV